VAASFLQDPRTPLHQNITMENYIFILLQWFKVKTKELRNCSCDNSVGVLCHHPWCHKSHIQFKKFGSILAAIEHICMSQHEYLVTSIRIKLPPKRRKLNLWLWLLDALYYTKRLNNVTVLACHPSPVSIWFSYQIIYYYIILYYIIFHVVFAVTYTRNHIKTHKKHINQKPKVAVKDYVYQKTMWRIISFWCLCREVNGTRVPSRKQWEEW